MSKRINTILKYINNEDVVLDIGCDQALLGIELAKKGMFSYAGDLRNNIIDNARKKVKEIGLSKYIEFKVSDGIEKFKDIKEINTLVLSGMGTFTILNILSKYKNQYKKIITISNNDHYVLRKEIIKLNYKISLEEVIEDKGKFYNLIIFEIGNERYNKNELYKGYNHQNQELLKKYLKYRLNKIHKIMGNNISSERKKELNKIIKILK